MGPRIREDNGWVGDGFPSPVFVGQALRGNCGSGCGNDGLGHEDGRQGGAGDGFPPSETFA